MPVGSYGSCAGLAFVVWWSEVSIVESSSWSSLSSFLWKVWDSLRLTARKDLGSLTLFVVRQGLPTVDNNHLLMELGS